MDKEQFILNRIEKEKSGMTLLGAGSKRTKKLTKHC